MHTYMKRKHSNKKKEGKAVNMDGLKLRQELILDYAMPYYAGVHIIIADMKSSNRSGNWARTAATEFHRADAFCAKWWYPETNKV